MNIPRHTFKAESKMALLEFLKIASEQKTQNKYCNLEEHKVLSRLFPMDKVLQQDKQFIDTEPECIDITQSDDEQDDLPISPEIFKSTDIDDLATTLQQNLNSTTTGDIADAIKENLELTTGIISNLCDCSSEKVEEIFTLLESELNFDQVYNFGVSIRDGGISNECVISSYFRYLFLNKLKKMQFSDGVQSLLKEYSVKYSEPLAKVISENLLESFENDEHQNEVFLQYIVGLNSQFKVKLFREFIFNCKKLHKTHISTLEALLNPQIETDYFHKVIKLMSNSAEEFSTDKSFGKLLMKVLQMLGRNIALVEQPLKHIIGTHRSIWKVKVQKIFSCRLDESMSQSLR